MAPDSKIIWLFSLSTITGILLVGEIFENSGENLSGGQTQRICIARALLRNPEILVLDEITSSLDEKNEKEIFKSIFEVMKGKTVIISIHKDVIDDLADEIYNIDDGKFKKVK